MSEVARLDTRPSPSEEALLGATIVGRRHPGRWVSAAVALLFVVLLGQTLVTNPRYQWDVVAHYFTEASILRGLGLTLWLTAAVMVCGYLLGIGLAAMRLSANPVLRAFSFGYVWLVRSVPPLVQLLVLVRPRVALPAAVARHTVRAEFVSVPTAHLFTGLLAAFVGLTLDVARVLRRDRPRRPALRRSRPDRGRAGARHEPRRGSSAGSCCRRRCAIIVPADRQPGDQHAQGDLDRQRHRPAGPAVLGAADLQPELPDHPAAAGRHLWYLILTTILSIGQYFVERHYARGSHADAPPELLRASW